MQDKCKKCNRRKENIARSYCTSCKRIINSLYYRNNRLKEINRVKKTLKEQNYKYEKTPKARRLRYIKRRTRYLYPLNRHRCEFCGRKATERHHNTRPIEIDKFNFVCHPCHLIQDKIIKEVKIWRKKQ